MAAINPLARELVLKIVFYGPGLGGKTTTLQHLHDSAKPEHRGKMVSLATAVDRTLYFDFLPLRVPKTRGMNVRLQLFTVPGQVYYNATRKLVLTGADGIVFVADSQAARIDANLESLENLQENLREQKRDLAHVPHIVQYNKRDIAGVATLLELEALLNPHHVPSVPTVATTGEGVAETLSLITRAVVDEFNRTLPAEGEASEMAFSADEGGIEGVLRRTDDPPPTRVPTSARTVAVLRENVLDPGAAPALSAFPDEEPTTGVTTPAPPAATPEPTLAARPGAEVPSPETARPALTPTFSFASLWGEGDRDIVRETEVAIAMGDHALAMGLLDTLATRVLASSAALLGPSDAPRDAAVIPMLLGIDGPRYLAFRALVRDTHGGIEPDDRAVLAAYAFVIELRLSRGRLAL